jgi:hypothetical protein
MLRENPIKLFFHWIWVAYQTLTLLQWLLSTIIGIAGMSAFPIIGVIYGWPIWQQATLAAIVTLFWLAIMAWTGKKNEKSTSPQSIIGDRNVQAGGDIKDSTIYTGDYYYVQPRTKQPNTHVIGCFDGCTYQVEAVNNGSDKDTIVITLVFTMGNSITDDIQPKIGVAPPELIHGGKGWEFVRFKITDILPKEKYIPLPMYFIYTKSGGSAPIKFTAQSEITGGDIPVDYHEECPKFVFGPEEKTHS